MGNLNLSARDIHRSVKKKLRLRNVVTTTETFGDYYLDDKLELRVKLPNEHGGSGRPVSHGLLRACRETLLLTTSEFALLVRCPMSAEQYDNLIRAKRDDLL